MVRIKKNSPDDGVYIFIQDKEMAGSMVTLGLLLAEKIESTKRYASYRNNNESNEVLKNIIGESQKMQQVK